MENISSDYDLLRVKRESLLLLKERGYVIPADEAAMLREDITIYEFKNLYENFRNDPGHILYEYISKREPRVALSNVYNRGKEQCLVYFAESDIGKTKKREVSKFEVANFCRIIADLEVNEAIMICNVPSSPTVETLVTNICEKTENRNEGVLIQYFMDEELLYNPLNHAYVPKHRILSNEEKEEMEKVYKIKGSQLPQISVFDPVCKRLGARPDNILEIERKILIDKNKLIEEEISYRYVIVPFVAKTRK